MQRQINRTWVEAPEGIFAITKVVSNTHTHKQNIEHINKAKQNKNHMSNHIIYMRYEMLSYFYKKKKTKMLCCWADAKGEIVCLFAENPWRIVEI